MRVSEMATNDEIIEKVNKFRLNLQGGCGGTVCLSTNKDAASYQDIIKALDEARADTAKQIFEEIEHIKVECDSPFLDLDFLSEFVRIKKKYGID